MVRGPATTQTHWVNSTAGVSPPSACLVGLSAATGWDRRHAVTHHVPIQAQHPLPAPRKRTPHSGSAHPPAFRLTHPRPRSPVGGADSLELTCTGRTCFSRYHLLGCRGREREKVQCQDQNVTWHSLMAKSCAGICSVSHACGQAVSRPR